MRSLAPAETLVYLETNDLAAALQPIVDSKPFTEVAKSKPDFSALKGVQLAVAVTGFETSEEKLTDEHSVGRVQPHFVAIADTHAFHFQAVKFAEAKLGSFVSTIYDSEPTVEQSDKNGGRYFKWTAKDGRKAYALVIDSLIYFGNDETAIDKCLAVKRGETDSIIKTGKVNFASQETLASGYVSTIGIAQIANIVGLQFASQASEDSQVQSAIAGILPQLLRNSITDITWTASLSEKGIEDKYQVGMPAEIANVFNETMAPDPQAKSGGVEHLSPDIPSATFYNFKNTQIAWSSLLLIGQKQVDPLGAKVIAEFSVLLFQPYAIHDPDAFLNTARSRILTANMTSDGEQPILVVSVVDVQTAKNSLTAMTSHFDSANTEGVLTWFDKDQSIAAKFSGNEVVVGNDEGVSACFNGGINNLKYDQNDQHLRELVESKASIATLTNDFESASQIAEIISGKNSNNVKAKSTYFTETRFTKTGMERKTTSDFGLIGAIIAQLGQD